MKNIIKLVVLLLPVIIFIYIFFFLNEGATDKEKKLFVFVEILYFLCYLFIAGRVKSEFLRKWIFFKN